MPFAASVLVATDLSSASYAALAEAARVAALGATHVCLLHVFDVSAFRQFPVDSTHSPDGAQRPIVLSENTLRRIAEEATGAAQSVLANLRARFFASVPGIRVELRTLEYDGAAAGICASAVSLSADLIVIGSHGRSGRARSALGSVAEKVVRSAPCRVLLVPTEDAESHTH